MMRDHFTENDIDGKDSYCDGNTNHGHVALTCDLTMNLNIALIGILRHSLSMQMPLNQCVFQRPH